MIEKAREIIIEEMNKNPYAKIIGQYVLKHIELNDSAAEKIVSGEKTIMLSLKEMEKEARKVAIQGCGVLAGEEAFKIVGKYFEFEAIQEVAFQTTVAKAITKIEEVQAEKTKKRKFHVDINDL